MEKVGFQQGMDWNYWRNPQNIDGISLTINEDTEVSPPRIYYKLDIYPGNDVFDDLNIHIKNWAQENGHDKAQKHTQWAYWLAEKIDELNKYEGLTINKSDMSRIVYFYTDNYELFKQILTDVSTILRDLAAKKYETLNQLFDKAKEDQGCLEMYTEKISDNVEDVIGYPLLWNNANILFEKWGINEQTLDLLAVLCTVPGRSTQKEVIKLNEKYNITEKLNEDGELKEQFFYQIQQHVNNYYIDQSSGYATKALVKKVAKMLAFIFETFGFGIYPNGMVTIIRLFENDVEEGIDINWYQSDSEYDSEDFGYYDGSENEEYYNTFWSGIDILELIK